MDKFIFDQNTVFEKDVPKHVSRNTADILRKTRYNTGFTVTNELEHIGAFNRNKYEKK